MACQILKCPKCKPPKIKNPLPVKVVGKAIRVEWSFHLPVLYSTICMMSNKNLEFSYMIFRILFSAD
nr:MAG TPA: hypothetical protein [Caudoviricetes sp.]DAR52291.1 MAG TPA: hypothetical protein [Caudoviricetes sp.]